VEFCSNNHTTTNNYIYTTAKCNKNLSHFRKILRALNNTSTWEKMKEVEKIFREREEINSGYYLLGN